MNRWNRLCIVLILMLAMILQGASGENSNITNLSRAYAGDFAIGSYVSFGIYPQTASGDDATPIEWLVLDIIGNEALLMSRYGLDAIPYNTSRTAITWDECSLRKWLNDDFIRCAFDDDEQAAILTSDIPNNDKQQYSDWETNGGNNTQDKLFLLSYAQATQTSADEPLAEEQPATPIAGFTTPADGATVPIGQKLLLEWTEVPDAKCYSVNVYPANSTNTEWYTHLENGELTVEIPRSTLVESSYLIELKAWKDAVYGNEIFSQEITINTYNKFEDNLNQAASNEANENPIRLSGEIGYQLLEDGTAAFVSFSGYGSLVIPETIDGYTISAVADGACYWNSALYSVSIPDTVKTIGTNAFSWCMSLESVHIGEGTTNIGDSAFSNNSNLHSIELPAGITHIGEYTFSDCPKLRYIQLPNQLIAMGEGAFSDCEGLQEIAIPTGIHSIPSSAFFRCTNLESVYLPEGLTDIGDFAFYGCENLTDIAIPSTVEAIGEWAFSYCTNLSKLSISDATVLGEGAFSECAL